MDTVIPVAIGIDKVRMNGNQSRNDSLLHPVSCHQSQTCRMSATAEFREVAYRTHLSTDRSIRTAFF